MLLQYLFNDFVAAVVAESSRGTVLFSLIKAKRYQSDLSVNSSVSSTTSLHFQEYLTAL